MADLPPTPEELAEWRAVLDAYDGALPLRLTETADYAEVHAANSTGTALAITVQPSIILLLNALPALIAAAEREAASTARADENWRKAAATRQELARVRGALRDLHATVRGECPSLLDEDSGGDARLALLIEDILSSTKETGDA